MSNDFVFKHRWVLYNILINTAGHAVREKEQTGQGRGSCPLPKMRRNYGAPVFYYGSWLMGVICLVSTLAVYSSNKEF